MAAPAINIEEPSIPEELLNALKKDIGLRQIGHGMNLLTNSGQILRSLRPEDKDAAALLDILAQWCDIGYGDLTLLKQLVAMYDKESRCRLAVSEYVHIRMAEGMLAMSQEMLDTAIDHFDVVLKLATETEAWDVLAIANYWMARCQRKKGQYDAALSYVKRARTVQVAHGQLQNEVPARVLESLILFENGHHQEALTDLQQAEATLMHSDDYVTLGKIQSTYGRILQRELRYEQAIQHFKRAIDIFQKRDPNHLSIAGALVSISFTRSQVARHFRQMIESCPRQSPQAVDRIPLRSKLITELLNLHKTILADLDRASQIYQRHGNARGIARVHRCRGY